MILRKMAGRLFNVENTLPRTTEPAGLADDASPPVRGRAGGSRAQGVRDAVGSALAVIGALAVAWVAVSSLLGLSVFVSEHGSPVSSLPAGSAAVVYRVPAAQLTVGDVVVVAMPGGSALSTYRIVAIQDVRHDSDSRSLVLGDESTGTVQAEPYTGSTAGVVLASSPHLGPVFRVLSGPAPGMCLGVVVGGAVLWALRPPQGRRHRTSSHAGRSS